MRKYLMIAAVSFAILFNAPSLHAQATAANSNIASCTATAEYDIISGGTKVTVVEQCFNNQGVELATVTHHAKCLTTIGNPIDAIVKTGNGTVSAGCGQAPAGAETILNSTVTSVFVTPTLEQTAFTAWNEAIPNHAPGNLVGSALCSQGAIAIVGVALTDHQGFSGCYSPAAVPALTGEDDTSD